MVSAETRDWSTVLFPEFVRRLKAEKRRTGQTARPAPYDVVRVDLSFNHQVVEFRDDQHDCIASRDHPANGVHFGFQHNPVLRSTEIDAFKLVFGRNLALHELAELGINLAIILATSLLRS